MLLGGVGEVAIAKWAVGKITTTLCARARLLIYDDRFPFCYVRCRFNNCNYNFFLEDLT